MKSTLGNTGIEVPPLIFGGNIFGWTPDEATSFALLDEMVEAHPTTEHKSAFFALSRTSRLVTS